MWFMPPPSSPKVKTFLKMILADRCTCPILGPLVPLFWISGDISSDFKAIMDSALFAFTEANVIYIP